MSKRELFVITGPFGSGKTTAGVTYTRPSEISGLYWYDSEGSGNRLLEQMIERGLKPGRYVDLRDYALDAIPDQNSLLDMIAAGDLPWVTEKQQDALIAYYEWMLNDISRNLQPGKYSHLLVDTGEMFEAGMTAWFEANKRKYGFSQKKDEAYGKIWTRGIFLLYENFLNAVWKRGIDTITFVFHLKQQWMNKRPVAGKVVPSGKKILWKYASLYFWMSTDRNPTGAPAALVLKERLGDLGLDDDADEWAPRRMIPSRIPDFSWAKVRRYLQEGCDMANPAPGEVLNTQERAMIQPLVMSNKQIELMIAEAEVELQKEQNATPPLLRSLDVYDGPGAGSGVDAVPVAKKEEDMDLVQRIRGMRLDVSDEDIRAVLKGEGKRMPEIMRAFKALDGVEV